MTDDPAYKQVDTTCDSCKKTYKANVLKVCDGCYDEWKDGDFKKLIAGQFTEGFKDLIHEKISGTGCGKNPHIIYYDDHSLYVLTLWSWCLSMTVYDLFSPGELIKESATIPINILKMALEGMEHQKESDK